MDAPAADVTVLTLAAGVDYAVTRVYVDRGYTELNPTQSEPALALVTKAAVIGATTATCGKLRRSGHRRAAKILRWGVASIWLGAAAYNYGRAR